MNNQYINIQILINAKIFHLIGFKLVVSLNPNYLLTLTFLFCVFKGFRF
jgi:hypothetical protein